MSSTTEPELAERVCAKCGASDTEPHHLSYVAMTHPVSGQSVDLSVSKHIQCCAEDGCPICGADVERAVQEGADPSRLRDFLVSRPEDHTQMLQEKFGVSVGEPNDD